jgi:hypothetical protein
MFLGQWILNQSQKPKNKQHRPPKNAKRDPMTRRKVQELDC